MAAIWTAFIDALPSRHGTPLRPERPHPHAGNDAELTLELLPRGGGGGSPRCQSRLRQARGLREVGGLAGGDVFAAQLGDELSDAWDVVDQVDPLAGAPQRLPRLHALRQVVVAHAAA